MILESISRNQKLHREVEKFLKNWVGKNLHLYKETANIHVKTPPRTLEEI